MITLKEIAATKARADAAIGTLIRVPKEHKSAADLYFLEGLCWQADSTLQWIREREAERGGR